MIKLVAMDMHENVA